jgi:hypothetical protein
VGIEPDRLLALNGRVSQAEPLSQGLARGLGVRVGHNPQSAGARGGDNPSTQHGSIPEQQKAEGGIPSCGSSALRVAGIQSIPKRFPVTKHGGLAAFASPSLPLV